MSYTISSYEDIPEITPMEEIPKLINRVQSGFRSHRTISLEYRKQQLRNLYYAVLDNYDVLKEAVHKDLHKPPHETDLTELFYVSNEIRWFIENLDTIAKPEKIKEVPLTLKLATGRIYKQPFGTVLIISPWNYPIGLSISPITAAIAAGNTVVFKPSEVSVNTSKALVKVLSKALDPEIFVGITGAVPEITEILKYKFDKIMYTGNGAVGRIISHAAAEHLTPVILELGGKSPVVVTKTADLRIAARRVLWGKQTNSGQTCVAPDYCLVDESIKSDFIKQLKIAYEEFDKNLDPNSPSYSHIISDRHFYRLKKYLDETKGDIILGGKSDAETRFFAPTIVDNVTASDSLMKEELFGPLLGLVSYKTLDEAVEFITKEHDTPLALYIFSTDKNEKKFILDRVRSGGVSINDTLMHLTFLHAPFGGIGESGSGSYHGIFGYKAFTHERTVLDQPGFVEFALDVRYPPYSESKNKQFALINGPVKNPFPRTGPIKKSFFQQYLNKFFWFFVILGAVAFKFKK